MVESVDSDLQAFLFPLNLVQIIYFLPKYIIYRNRLRNGAILYTMYIIGAISIIALYIWRTFRTIGTLPVTGTTELYLNFMLYFGIVFYTIGYLLYPITYCCNIRSNVKLVLKIQRVHRILQTDGNKFRNFIIWNWIHIFLLCFWFMGLILIMFSFLSTEYFGLYSIIDIIFLIYFDTDLLYASRLIKLLRYQTLAWIEQNSCPKLHENTRLRYRQMYCHDMLRAYLCVLDAYNISKKIFEYMITYRLVEVYVHYLLYIQLYIEICKSKGGIEHYISNSVAGIVMLTWLLKNLVLIFVLSVECEKFYVALSNLVVLCMTNIRKENCSEEEKRLYKNICRVNQAIFKKMKVCGMFTIDGTLPIRMIGSLTTYIVVLLQFAFL